MKKKLLFSLTLIFSQINCVNEIKPEKDCIGGKIIQNKDGESECYCPFASRLVKDPQSGTSYCVSVIYDTYKKTETKIREGLSSVASTAEKATEAVVDTTKKAAKKVAETAEKTAETAEETFKNIFS